MPDLHIPDGSHHALDRIISAAAGDGSWGHPDGVDAAVRTIAAPVVASELRRLAEKVEKVSAFRLRARADELDPPRS